MAVNSFSIAFSKSPGKREAYRVRIDGLQVRLMGRPAEYSTTDLSPTGVGLSGCTGMRAGELHEFGLFHQGHRLTQNLTARVVRTDASVAGLAFENLDRHAQDALYGLVLDEQKRQVEARKAVRLDFE